MVRGLANEVVACLVISNVQIVDAGKLRAALWMEVGLVFAVMLWNLGCFGLGAYRMLRPAGAKVSEVVLPDGNVTVENFNDQLEQEIAGKNRKKRRLLSTVTQIA
jgi:hypothetical protein